MQFDYVDGKRVRGEINGVNLPPSTSDSTPPNSDTNSPVQEISAPVADSEGDHVLALASLIMRSAVSNVEPRIFFNIELNGRKLLDMLDDGSVHSYLGKGVSKEFAGKLEQEATSVRVAGGAAVKLQGVLNMTVSIDNTQLTIPFRVADELQYDCILGIDFKRAFNMKIDYENGTWWMPKGVVHQFYPYGQDPTYFPAPASIGGLSCATADQQSVIEAIKEKLIPPTPE